MRPVRHMRARSAAVEVPRSGMRVRGRRDSPPGRRRLVEPRPYVSHVLRRKELDVCTDLLDRWLGDREMLDGWVESKTRSPVAPASGAEYSPRGLVSSFEPLVDLGNGPMRIASFVSVTRITIS